MIELTEDEFATVYEALRLVTHTYTEEEVPHVVAMERMAWNAVEAAKHRADQTA